MWSRAHKKQKDPLTLDALKHMKSGLKARMNRNLWRTRTRIKTPWQDAFFSGHCSRFHFPSDKPQVCLLNALICLVWARSWTQSPLMAHNEAGTVPGSLWLITVSTVMALHCCESTMLFRPCHSDSAAGEPDLPLKFPFGLRCPRRAWMIDDADRERPQRGKHRF